MSSIVFSKLNYDHVHFSTFEMHSSYWTLEYCIRCCIADYSILPLNKPTPLILVFLVHHSFCRDQLCEHWVMVERYAFEHTPGKYEVRK